VVRASPALPRRVAQSQSAVTSPPSLTSPVEHGQYAGEWWVRLAFLLPCCSLAKSFKTACHEHRPSEQLPLSARCRDKLRKIVMRMTLNRDRHLE